MVKYGLVLLVYWAVCPGVPRCHRFDVFTTVFGFVLVFCCIVCYYVGLLVELGWIMEWEAPKYVHWITISFNIVFSYYGSVFVKHYNTSNSTQIIN